MVDELVMSFTYDITMSHPLPGVPPTGKRVGLAVCVVAGFQQLEYLHRRAALLHRLVDVLGDEPSRSLAQDADDRARRAQAVSPLEDPRSRNAR